MDGCYSIKNTETTKLSKHVHFMSIQETFFLSETQEYIELIQHKW